MNIPNLSGGATTVPFNSKDNWEKKSWISTAFKRKTNRKNKTTARIDEQPSSKKNHGMHVPSPSISFHPNYCKKGN